MEHPPTAAAGSELRRTRSLLADLDGVVWEAEARSMTFTFVSEGARELFGWTPQEWLASPSFWADHLHPDDRQRIVSRFVRTATGGGHFDEEYRFLAKDDTWVWVRDLGHAVKDAEGNPTTIRGLMVEITSRKLLEAERADADQGNGPQQGDAGTVELQEGQSAQDHAQVNHGEYRQNRRVHSYCS